MIIPNLIDYLNKIFNINKKGKGAAELIQLMRNAEMSVMYKRLAIDTCVDIIANAFLSCNFTTYEDGKEKRGNTYYWFNVSPNQNESAAMFKKKLMSRLLKKNECLVVNVNDMIYIADDYTVDEFALYGNVYKNVTVGTLTFDKPFAEKDVFYFKLADENIKRVLDGVYDDYKKLVEISKEAFGNRNTKHVILSGGALWSMDEKSQTERDEMFNQALANWYKGGGGINAFALPQGITMEEWAEKTTANTDAREIKNLINDIYEFTSSAYHVPISIIKGDKLDIKSEIDSLIMFGVRPLVNIIESGINAKLYTKSQYLSKNYLKIDMSMIKMYDITSLAAAADKLFLSGINSVNDGLKLFGRETINEPWADEHYTTKNYQSIVKSLKGGEKNETVTKNSETP